MINRSYWGNVRPVPRSRAPCARPPSKNWNAWLWIHGFTHFALAVGKFCGFDLCPRLAGIRSRKLYLPRGYHGTVPDVLKPIVSQETISRKAIARGWDGFARLSASIKDGWYPAPERRSFR
jgi:hypothetical protein